MVSYCSAKEKLVVFVGVDLTSGRSLIVSDGSDEIPNLIEKKIRAPLSNMDKALALTGMALDNEIKEYDKNWDGTGKSNDERKLKIIK